MANRIAVCVSVIAAAGLLGGCAYNAPVAVTPNLNVYSSYGEKLPGSYALYVDGEAFSQTVRPTGYNCSAHNFPVDMRDSFRQSVVKTMQQLVDEVEVVQNPISADGLVRSGKRGQIIVRADGMTARVQFIPGFWSATSVSSVELTANMSVDGPNGRVLGTTAEGTGTAQGEAGLMCGGGADVVAQAVEKATKQLLGQLGERLSNSPRMRADSYNSPSTVLSAAIPARPAPTPPAASTSPQATNPTSRRTPCVRVMTDPSQNRC